MDDDYKYNKAAAFNSRGRLLPRMNFKSYLYLFAFLVAVCLFVQLVVPVLSPVVGDMGLRSVQDFMINQQLIKVDTNEVKGHTLLANAALSRGLQEMSSSNVSILGVARNIGGKLPGVLIQVR